MSEPRRHCGDDASQDGLDIKGNPVGRRAAGVPVLAPVFSARGVERERVVGREPKRPVCADDVEILRPLYQLGARYHAGATALRRAIDQADAAAVTWVDADDDRRWRSQARAVLDASDAVADAGLELRDLPATEGAFAACAAATRALTDIVRRGASPVAGSAAVRNLKDAASDVPFALVAYGLPWRQLAFWGWQHGTEGRPWLDAWCARAWHWQSQLFPDETIARATQVDLSADAVRKRRARWRW